MKDVGPEHADVAASHKNLGLVHRKLVTLNKQNNVTSERWMFTGKSSDLRKLMSQHLTITWVLYLVWWVT